MKRCPKCNRTFSNDTQRFCTHDGESLAPVDMGQATIIDSPPPEAHDAPTKVISRELVPQGATIPFDPLKTVVEPAVGIEETTQTRGRITQDLNPPTPQSSAPLPAQPPTTSGTLQPQSPTSGTLQQPPPPAVGSGPIGTSAPLPSQQFAAASAQQVQPLAAARPKKSKLPLILGILAVLLVLGAGGLGAAYLFVVRPWLDQRRLVITQQPPIQNPGQPVANPEVTPAAVPSSTPVEEPPPYSPPSDAVQFVNSNLNLDGKLAEHYVDFSFYYPERWEKDPKSGVPGASNFVKVERRLPPDFTQENFAVGWYSSGGSGEADRILFHTLAENLSAQFERNFPEYRKVSEGEVKAGVYNGYEFRFEAASRNTAKGDLKLWGRLILLPPPDGGKNGLTLLMLATSLAPELRTVEDVGVKGELAMILESFRFGKK